MLQLMFISILYNALQVSATTQNKKTVSIEQNKYDYPENLREIILFVYTFITKTQIKNRRFSFSITIELVGK